MDLDYVGTPLSFAVPPAAGISISIDRLAMLFTIRAPFAKSFFSPAFAFPSGDQSYEISPGLWRSGLRITRTGRRSSSVTVFAIMGVTAGVATLVITVAINDGFRATMPAVLGVTAHVSMSRFPGSAALSVYGPLAEAPLHWFRRQGSGPGHLHFMLLLLRRARQRCRREKIDPALNQSVIQRSEGSSPQHGLHTNPDGFNSIIVGKILSKNSSLEPDHFSLSPARPAK